MNIYVGNLDFRVDEEALRSAFENYGAVSDARVVTDKYTGRSKGFGFITMDNDAEAQKAIRGLNGSTLENRDLTVNEARPKNNY